MQAIVASADSDLFPCGKQQERPAVSTDTVQATPKPVSTGGLQHMAETAASNSFGPLETSCLQVAKGTVVTQTTL